MLLAELFKIILWTSTAGSIVAGILLLIKSVLKNRFNARWHYYLWFFLMLRLAVPVFPESPVSVFNLVGPTMQRSVMIQEGADSLNPQNTLPVIWNEMQNWRSTETTFQFSEQAVPDGQEKINNNQFPLFNALSFLWFSGALLMLFYIFSVHLSMQFRLKRVPGCREPEVLNIVKECRCLLRIKQRVPVVCDPRVRVPSLYGFFRPRLLFPPDLLKNLTGEEKRYIILHELTHIRRRDILVNWAMLIIQALHWFNPVVWYGFYRMREDCEAACGDWAFGAGNQ